MKENPRHYPDTMKSPESGRPMTRGEKLVSFKESGNTYFYRQPGWWCSLSDPNDKEGQLVDDDNLVAEAARRNAKALARGEQVFIPSIIKAIRIRLGLTQREAGNLFATGEKSFEKYETGEIPPSGPTKQLFRIAWACPNVFVGKGKPAIRNFHLTAADDDTLVHEALRSIGFEHYLEPLFKHPSPH
jgi:HTH-type transcriptional regulator / antitoxin MqsA